jgi:hypothetical protein
MKSTRQQLELLLRDARAHAQLHWEIRALLALALLCQDEAEDEAAGDYLAAARRKLGEAEDKRAEFYTLQTAGIMLLDGGRVAEATRMLEGALVQSLLPPATRTPRALVPLYFCGHSLVPLCVRAQALADEMCDRGLAARCLANLSNAHRVAGNLPRAVELGTKALGLARLRGDLHFLCVSLVALGCAQRLLGELSEARKLLREACSCAATLDVVARRRGLQGGGHLELMRRPLVAGTVAESLGYAHLLSAALSQLGLAELEGAPRPPPQPLLKSCMDKLVRACAISEANGLRRAACDDLHNWNAAVLRCAGGRRVQCGSAEPTKRLGEVDLARRALLGRYGYGGADGRNKALTELARADRLAKEIEYKSARFRIQLAIGLGKLGASGGGAAPQPIGKGDADADATAPWTKKRSDLTEAEQALSSAATLLPSGVYTMQHAELSGARAYLHMVHAQPHLGEGGRLHLVALQG